MKIEDQVCSLELAKRLNELGVEQESLFCWVVNRSGWHVVETDNINEENYCCCAFTVAELGEMLPRKIKLDQNFNSLKLQVYKDKPEVWMVGYGVVRPFAVHEGDATEANARAKLLIYLLEHGLVKP